MPEVVCSSLPLAFPRDPSMTTPSLLTRARVPVEGLLRSTAHRTPPPSTQRLRAAAEAWAEPGARDGETVMGATPMPAAVVGPMMLAEFAVHGWDVARAAGAAYEVPEELGRAVLTAVEGMAQMGRDGGWYGPEVPVPDDAPAFDRALGLAGRDPGWTPAP